MIPDNAYDILHHIAQDLVSFGWDFDLAIHRSACAASNLSVWFAITSDPEKTGQLAWSLRGPGRSFYFPVASPEAATQLYAALCSIFTKVELQVDELLPQSPDKSDALFLFLHLQFID